MNACAVLQQRRMGCVVQDSTVRAGLILLVICVVCLLNYRSVYYLPTSSGTEEALTREHDVNKMMQTTLLRATPGRFPNTCNMTWFRQELRLDAIPPVIPRELLSTCQRIIYNRIPKCASRTFRDVFRVLAIQHNLTHIFIVQKWDGLRNPKIRNIYGVQMKAAKGRFILTSHFYFSQFPELYDDDTVVFVDITREPVDWFQSLYAWKRYGSREDPHHGKINQNVTQYIRHPGFMKWTAAFGSLNMLCGTKHECFFPNQSEKSVTMALENVDRHYLTVGLFEDLPAYVEVLEYIMPQVFSNIAHVYNQVSRFTRKSSSTIHKDDFDAESESILRPHLVHEFALYNQLKTRFYDLVSAVRALKAAQQTI